MNLRLRVAAGVGWVLALSALAHAQNIDRVRELYVAAAYEEALAAMPAASGGRLRTDLEQYRALCLLALGREQEAIVTVERLVRDNPTFAPPADDTSPRLRSVFLDARSKVVPPMAKRTYLDAKAAFEAKDRAAAVAGFQRTLDLVASLPETARAGLADLNLLATEFLELSAGLPERAAEPLPTVLPVQSRTPNPVALPDGLPVAIREELPKWIPPDGVARRTEYTGLLRVLIGPDGRVQSATIVDNSHPAYDAAVLRAAREWTYQPAIKGGESVSAQKDILIRLVPR